MYMKLKDGKSKVLTLSYDDGVMQDIRLMKILDAKGLKCTFNINTGWYAPEEAVREKPSGRMKLSEAQKAYINSGHEVAIHGYDHLFMEKLKTDEIITEVIDDRRDIEKKYGVLARGMAYPFGRYNDEVIRVLKECGICYARTTQNTSSFAFPEKWLAWHPTCHHRHPNLMEMAEKFVGLKSRYVGENWMFYVWGHAFEFDDQNNWEVIEKFAEYIGGKDDIWYATNIEIYDYVKAYENLQTSVDKTIVHNPSAIEVWFAHKNQLHCVKGGQALYL